MAGLRLRLAPGWKTYWRAPGDAGIPPRFDWGASRNVTEVVPHWPVPHVFDLNGLRTIGYKGEVVLPLEVRVSGAGPARLEGVVDLGVCDEICIPVSVSVSADLPMGEGAGSAAIRAALAQEPADMGGPKATCRLDPLPDGMRVTATLALPAIASDETAVVELADPSVWVSEATSQRKGDRLTVAAELVPASAGAFAVARDALRFTVLGGGRGVEVLGCSAG